MSAKKFKRPDKHAVRRDLERRARRYGVSNRDVRTAAALVDRFPHLDAIVENLTPAVGRPRHLGWRPTLILLVLHAMTSRSNMVLREVHLRAVAMTPKQRAISNIPTFVAEHHIRSNIDRLATAFGRIDKSTGEILVEPQLPFTLDQMVSSMCQATIPDWLAQNSTVALDGTDLESHYAHQSMPIDEDGNYSRLGDDGRAQYTADPDARGGHRSPMRGRGDLYIGYMAHLVCDVPEIRAPSRPALVRGMSIRPAGTDPSESGLAAIDTLASRPADVLADRGYSPLAPYAYGVVARGAMLVGDLKEFERGTRPGPKPGTVWLDGTLFSDCVPEELRALPGFGRNMPQDERVALARRYEDRARYTFTRQGKISATTKMRLRGPALTGRVRCINNPDSMRKSRNHTRPRTTCIKGQPCGCSLTLTINAKEHPRAFQRHPYGGLKWLASYGRRVAIEEVNAELKHNRGNLTRNSFRVRGLHKVALLFGLFAAAINVLILEDWYSMEWLEMFQHHTEPPKFPRKPQRQDATHRSLFGTKLLT